MKKVFTTIIAMSFWVAGSLAASETKKAEVELLSFIMNNTYYGVTDSAVTKVDLLTGEFTIDYVNGEKVAFFHEIDTSGAYKLFAPEYFGMLIAGDVDGSELKELGSCGGLGLLAENAIIFAQQTCDQYGDGSQACAQASQQATQAVNDYARCVAAEQIK